MNLPRARGRAKRTVSRTQEDIFTCKDKPWLSTSTVDRDFHSLSSKNEPRHIIDQQRRLWLFLQSDAYAHPKIAQLKIVSVIHDVLSAIWGVQHVSQPMDNMYMQRAIRPPVIDKRTHMITSSVTHLNSPGINPPLDICEWLCQCEYITTSSAERAWALIHFFYLWRWYAVFSKALTQDASHVSLCLPGPAISVRKFLVTTWDPLGGLCDNITSEMFSRMYKNISTHAHFY